MATVNSSMTTKKINKVLKENRSVTFKSGTYNIDTSLIVYSDTVVKCEKDVVFQRQFKGRMVQMFVEPTTTKYAGTHDVKWSGGTFKANTHEGNANVFVMFHCKNIDVSGVTIDGCRGLHSIEVNASSNVNIKDCKILNQTSKPKETFREAIQIDFANKDGLSISGAADNAKCYDGTHCKDVSISGCTISNCPNGIGTHTVGLDGTKFHTGISISNCRFNNINKYAIKILGMDGVTVSNCLGGKFIVNKIKTAHLLAGGKVDLPDYRYNSNVTIDNITFA